MPAQKSSFWMCINYSLLIHPTLWSGAKYFSIYWQLHPSSEAGFFKSNLSIVSKPTSISSSSSSQCLSLTRKQWLAAWVFCVGFKFYVLLRLSFFWCVLVFICLTTSCQEFKACKRILANLPYWYFSEQIKYQLILVNYIVSYLSLLVKDGGNYMKPNCFWWT